MPTVGSRRCPPYVALSRAYDHALGARFFARSRRIYRRLAKRFDIAPRVAADLGAGTGLFAAWLSRTLGIRVYAVDKSAAMLRAGQANLLGSLVVPLRQDIRRLALPEPVDLATAHYDTINHIVAPEEVRDVFAAVARALRPGGFFLFDFITPNQRDGVQVHRLRCRSGVQVIQRISYAPARRLLRIRIVIRRRSAPCRVVERHLERAYAPYEVAAWLHGAGFIIRGLFDARSGRPVLYSCPPRIVVLAQRGP